MKFYYRPLRFDAREIINIFFANLLINNIFNSEGLAISFGGNSFGGNANSAKPEFIQANRDANFVHVPILPRNSLLSLRYKM